MPGLKTLDSLALAGKTVLLRGDLNVPMQDGVVSDTTRLDRLKPTVDRLIDAGAKVVLMSHFGRPKDGPDPAFSLSHITKALSAALDRPVVMAADCIGAVARKMIEDLQAGEIGLLENLRFHKGEEKNDPAFVADLASLGDVFVNDAFSAAHRAHASTEGLAHKLPAAAGLLMQAEIEALTAALDAPKRPVGAVVGGAKVSTKLDLLGNLIEKVDLLVLGGGMANTFLLAKGIGIGKSLAEPDMLDTARAIMDKAAARNCQLLLPVDGLVAREFKAGAAYETVAVTAIPADAMMLDCGPDSIQSIKSALNACPTIVWNGPLGAFEIPPFDTATVAVAQHVAAMSRAGQCRSVAGGGDTVAALAAAGVEDQFSYVSTAGGAFLEWLEGRVLPGVAALMA